MKKASAKSDRAQKLILKHAMTEFATKGYDGARVDSIASRCGFSKNMLYHYFGSKEGLFVAVLEGTYTTFRASQEDLEIRSTDPVEAMRGLISHTFSGLLKNQEFIAILNSENLHKGRHIRRSRVIRSLYDPLINSISGILQKGAAEGVFKANLDPVNLYVALSALAYNYISNQYTLNMALGIDFTTRKRRAAWLTYITDLILNYCRVEDR